MGSMRVTTGWTLLTLGALMVLLGLWRPLLPSAPGLAAETGLLDAGPDWYLHAAYLAVAAVLACAGAWLVIGGRRDV